MAILAAAGIKSPDYVPRRFCQLRRAGWTGRHPTWTIPVDPHRVGWETGLWIPAAARMTGVGNKMDLDSRYGDGDGVIK